MLYRSPESDRAELAEQWAWQDRAEHLARFRELPDTCTVTTPAPKPAPASSPEPEQPTQ